MGINLNDFLQRASNPTECKISISPRGEIKYQRTNAFMQKLFSTFKKKSKEINDVQFTYEVLTGVVDLLRIGRMEQHETVEKAAYAFYRRIRDQWEELDEEQQERFFELPQLFSYHAYENKDVIEDQMVRKLNDSYANSLGTDIFRLVTNESLSLILPDGTIATPSFSDHGTLFDFSKCLCETLDLSDEMQKKLTLCFYSGLNGQAKFEKFFDIHKQFASRDISNLEEYGLICSLFNSFSQAAVLEVGGILMRTFGSPFRPVFTIGSHDTVELDLRKVESSSIEVCHHFQLAFRQNHRLAKDLEKACFDVHTRSKFNTRDQRWFSHNTAIAIIDRHLTPRVSYHLRDRLRKAGY
ncbi:MAG: hypothetical protein ACSNEK_10180 [Parachlamydiaceae bacterium]